MNAGFNKIQCGLICVFCFLFVLIYFSKSKCQKFSYDRESVFIIKLWWNKKNLRNDCYLFRRFNVFFKLFSTQAPPPPMAFMKSSRGLFFGFLVPLRWKTQSTNPFKPIDKANKSTQKEFYFFRLLAWAGSSSSLYITGRSESSHANGLEVKNCRREVFVTIFRRRIR